MSRAGFLLTRMEDLDAYRADGGGVALERASRLGPEAVATQIRASGLRGRGGAGFPTGLKWQGLQREEEEPRYLVCNAAEGEPGTYKDRALMRANPYQLIEGVAVAALAVGAEEAYIATKARFTPQIERLRAAMEQMAEADMVGDIPITLVEGPDDYLFGEEKALLEVIAGRDPLPTLYPPYINGLFAGGDDPNPTVVNNVETLSNVPHIMQHGAEWFRSMGTADSPGTMVFTISGDVQHEGVVELPLGTPLAVLVYGFGEGLAAGRRIKAMVSGVSNVPLTAADIDTPMDFEAMAAAGSGLGSGGYIVYDDTACIAQVAGMLSAFLWRESCGQCPPCKLGTGELTGRFESIAAGEGDVGDLEDALAWTERVTDANRCGLGAGQRALAKGFLERHWDELVGHLEEGCPGHRERLLPSFAGYDEIAGRFEYLEA